MKDVTIYFTREAYNDYRNGSIAIGYTSEQMDRLLKLKKLGHDVLSSAPLNHMTKVRPSHISSIPWNENGVYVCKPRRGEKVYGF